MRHRIIAAAALSFAVMLGAGQPDNPSGTPSGVAGTYLRLLAADQPYRAVDECVDARGLAKRVFGADFDKLAPDRAAYAEQLTSVAIKATLSAAHLETVLPKARRTPFKVAERGNEATVSFHLLLPEAPSAAPGGDAEQSAESRQRKFELAMVRGEDGWRIVDFEPVAARWKEGYVAAKGQGATPVDFMETIALTLITAKLDPGAPEREMREAMGANIQVQLDTLNNQLELYKAVNKRYPDLVANGWKELIDAGYVKSAPVNPTNGRSEICAGSTDRAGFGWHWDAKSGVLGACGFDEHRGAVTAVVDDAGQR